MKLAEALLLRADMQKKLASLNSRIRENVKVQDGDDPTETPEGLIVEANSVIGELYELIARIQKTNATAMLPTGKTMLMALIERDELKERYQLLRNAIQNSKTEEDRYSFREIKWKRTVDIAGLQKQADDISVKIRELNIEIQATNWQVDLI